MTFTCEACLDGRHLRCRTIACACDCRRHARPAPVVRAPKPKRVRAKRPTERRIGDNLAMSMKNQNKSALIQAGLLAKANGQTWRAIGEQLGVDYSYLAKLCKKAS